MSTDVLSFDMMLDSRQDEPLRRCQMQFAGCALNARCTRRPCVPCASNPLCIRCVCALYALCRRPVFARRAGSASVARCAFLVNLPVPAKF